MKWLRYFIKTSGQKIKNGKMLSFFLLMLLVLTDYNRPMRIFAEKMKYPVSWCVFPFLMSGYTFLILFWFGIIFINSDIPFTQHSNMYQVIRTGRLKWGIGQIIGIIVRSIAVVGGTAICSIFTLLPGVEWTNEWGKLLHTAALQGMTMEQNLQYVIYYGILQEYEPLQLMGIVFIITVLTAIFMALLMFLICVYLNRVFAVAVTTGATILVFWVLNVLPDVKYKIAYWTPAIWPQIAKTTTPEYGRYWMPSLSYMIVFLGVGIIIMSFLILFRIQKCDMNWENEDM